MNTNKHYLSNNVLLQIAFILIILIVFGLITNNLLSFFPGFLGAICLYVLLYNPLQWMLKTKKWNKLTSVILLMVGSAVFIIGPLYLLIKMLHVMR